MQYRAPDASGARVDRASSWPANRSRADELLSAVKVACVLYYVTYYLLISFLFSKTIGLFAEGGGEAVSRALELSVLLVEGVHALALLGGAPKVRPPELWVFFANAVWMLVSRFLLGESVLLHVDDLVLFALLMLLIFATGMSLSGAWRQRLLALLTLELVGVTTVWGLAGLVTVLQGTCARSFEWVTFVPKDGAARDLYIMFFSVNRNITAAYYLMAAGLLINRCVGCRSRERRHLWRVVAAFYLPLSCMTMALQDCRSAAVGLTFLLSATIACVSAHWVKGQSNARARHMAAPMGGGLVSRRALCGAFLLACMAVMMLGGNRFADALFERAVGQASAQVDGSAHTALTDDALVSDDSAGAPVPALTQDHEKKVSPYGHNSWWSIVKLSGRMYIWAAIVPTMRDNPRMLLLGCSPDIGMKAINEHVVREYESNMVYSHMHNVFFQQLVCAGLPGLVLYLALTFLLLRRMPACFHRELGHDANPLSVLSLLLVAFMFYAMMEPLLSSRLPLATVLFCAVAGVFAAESEEMASEEAGCSVGRNLSS